MHITAKSLGTFPPFDQLNQQELNTLFNESKERLYKKESLLYHQNHSKLKYIDFIFEGTYQTYFVGDNFEREEEELMETREVYGCISILFNNTLSIRSVLATAGTKVLRVPANLLLDLVQTKPEFKTHFSEQFGNKMLDNEYAERIKNLETKTSSSLYEHFFSKSISSVQSRKLVSCHENDSVQTAAQTMSTERESCIFVQDATGKYLGYLTDITLREEVLAKGKDFTLPAKEFMQQPIFVIPNDALIYEAILMMFKHKIRYIVVTENDQYIGLLSRNKLLSDQSHSPFMFIQGVKLATGAEELKQRWADTPEIVFQLLSRGVRSENVNQVVTTISDSIANMVIEKVIAEMGKPPCKFVFMSLGSEGRREQTLKTDQDNAVIYEDRPAEEREGIREYFLTFADKVSEQLDYIGFVYCTGGYMAKNPEWNHSLSSWKKKYSGWIENIVPETAANFATFFDARRVYGDRDLIDELKQHIVLQLDKTTSQLYYHLAVEALRFEPPLTFFNNIKTISRGKQEVFDIKQAMTPIVDLARVYSLKQKITETNTGKRLLELYRMNLLSKEQYYELLQAYYYLMNLRLKNQAKAAIRKQGELSNYIVPKNLTNIERVTLREIFKVIGRFQQKVKMEFTGANLF